MARSVLGSVGNRTTPQTEPTPGRTDEVRNNAGGYVFQIDKWARLDRFLILGVDAGTYYVKPRPLALDNAKNIQACLDEDFSRTIDTAVNVSLAGRAPNNDPALFVLAVGAGHSDPAVRRYALSHLGDVARIGTHLFHFLTFVQGFRGWGRLLQNAVNDWFTTKSVDDLAWQVIKYRQRDGWSQRDVLRKAHPRSTDPAVNTVFRFAAGHDDIDPETVPKSIEGFIKIQAASDPSEAAELVREYRLPWETVPSPLLVGDQVWRALLETPGALPLGALLRNLGVLTNRNILTPGSTAAKAVAARLTDPEAIRKARIHPVGVLNALVTYTGGESRGGVSWTANRTISDALDSAFYTAFGNVEPTGKRIMLALDVSGSMGWSACNGSAFNAREGSAAMAMVTDAVEKDLVIVGFCHDLQTLDISSRRRLDDNVQAVSNLRFGSTDCALPMLWAMQNNIEIDAYITYTDNETWSGQVKPVQALRQYRDKTGIDARSVVVGMTATEFTIADPSDAGQLDVVGFDTAAPNVISGFISA